MVTYYERDGFACVLMNVFVGERERERQSKRYFMSNRYSWVLCERYIF